MKWDQVHNLETRVRGGNKRVVKKRRTRTYLFPICPESTLLSVEIAEVPSLQERIVAEPYAGHDVTSAEGDLLCLGKELVHAAIQGHFPNILDGDELLWPDLGRVENVKVELVFS